MAEEQDKSQKTEQPTQKRLDDARKKGQIASSREVGSFFLLATAALLAATAAPSAAHDLTMVLRAFLAQAHELPTDPSGLGRVLVGGLLTTAGIVALPFLGFVAAAVLAAAVQNGIVWSGESLKPKSERISPLAGLKRLFSMKSLVEFAKNVVKILIVTVAGAAALWPDRNRLVAAAQLETGPLAGYVASLSLRLLLTAAVIMALLAALDYGWQRFDYLQQMRMSRRDLQDEHKQSEGDPHIKGRLRQLRAERARQRMMTEVPKATVVVTNPTHVSVALRYDPDQSPAPIVVAKGVDHLALTIREVARANGVPIMESPPLARALNRSVDVGHAIPQQHYQAVAEIIGHVMRLNERAKAGPGA